jgi:hypothetical protein
MRHYPCTETCDLIDLQHIYLGPEMHAALARRGRELHGEHWAYSHGLVKDHHLFPLGRLASNEAAFVRHVPLPPVQLQRLGSKFDILDGRHRIVLSILYGHTHVPAVVRSHP